MTDTSSDISRRSLLFGLSVFPALASPPPDRQNVIVFKDQGRYGGWPANHGLWSWENELVVGFTSAWFKHATNDHSVDRSRRFEDWQARSLDGGQTWTIEKPAITTNSDNFIPKTEALKHPIDFTAPGLALMFGMPDLHGGPSWFYVSADRCRTWSAPFAFAVEGIDRLAARTNYQVYSRHKCIMFGSAAKADGKEGRVFCARTVDGGLTWKLLSLIGPEPSGYMIMPSAVRLGDSHLLTAIRHKDPDKQGSIDFYVSDDVGRNWSRSGAIENLGGGNPPALVKMTDGRLALTYGYRAKPFGIRARVSEDKGLTWGTEIVLRDDGLSGDLGYPVSAQRPDGRIFSAYYFNGPRDEDRAIEATIWRP